MGPHMQSKRHKNSLNWLIYFFVNSRFDCSLVFHGLFNNFFLNGYLPLLNLSAENLERNFYEILLGWPWFPSFLDFRDSHCTFTCQDAKNTFLVPKNS